MPMLTFTISMPAVVMMLTLCMLGNVNTFCLLLIFFHFILKFLRLLSECQTVRIQIRPDIGPDLDRNCLQRLRTQS